MSKLKALKQLAKLQVEADGSPEEEPSARSPTSYGPTLSDERMKKIYIAKNPADAHLLKALLEGEGIQADVIGEFLYSCRGEVPISRDTLPSVWVLEDSDYEKAEEIMRQYRLADNGATGNGEEWKCPGCGEANEGLFTECWQCGRSRPP